MTWAPHVTVAAIAGDGGRYLLVEETDRGRRVFNQPAGHLEENESLVEAVAREVLEETAWRFEPEHLTGIYLMPGGPSAPTYLRFCFYGRCRDHDPGRALDCGIVRAAWLRPDELESGRYPLRSPLVLQSLRDHLAGRRYPLDLVRHFGPGGAWTGPAG